jgi:preprotein translocase subunit SecY
MSILIFASVVSRLPAQGSAIYTEGSKVQFFTIILIGIGMIVGIVFVESGQRRIPVQFAKRVVGRRMYGGQSTYIPLKVNQSGVIPVIFASSILAFPALIASALGNNAVGLQQWINDNLVNNHGWWYITFYTVLIIFFAYFYTAIAFNPQQQADIIRKQGGFIPGIRPGPQTERYLAKVLNRITLPGSLFLATIAVVPLLVFALWDIKQFPFGGTALLITVGVALETMKQIDSQLMMRNYEGFLA